MRWSILPMMMMISAALMPGPADAQGQPEDVVQCTLSRPDQAGFSGVAAISRGQAKWVHARGVIGEAGSAPITETTRFNIGSAGKMFTAVAIGQLIAAGKVHLDDQVGRFVDGLPPETAAVTVRQLLTHTSGLGNFFTPDAVPVLQHITRLRDLMPLIAGERPRFPPGTQFEYSNTGFALLGMVVERVSGQSYGDYLAAKIFQPAGMSATGLAFAAGATAQGMSTGSMPRLLPPRGEAGGPPPEGGARGLPPREGPRAAAAEGALRPSPESTMPATPAGGLFSSAGDMTRFFQALAGGKLLGAETVRSFTTRQVDGAPARGDLPALYYGFGFGTGSFEGHRWFGHNGGAPGVNAEAIMFPDDDLVIVVLANRDPPTATSLFRALRAALLRSGTAVPTC